MPYQIGNYVPHIFSHHRVMVHVQWPWWRLCCMNALVVYELNFECLLTLLYKESEDEHEEELAVAADTDDQAEPSMIQGTDALMTVVDMQDNSLAAVEAEAQEYND